MTIETRRILAGIGFLIGHILYELWGVVGVLL